MKKNNWLSKLFVILVLLFNYLPIIVVVVYSFNASKYSNWAGFSLQWYEKLFRNSQILRSLNNSLILAFSSCGLSILIGTAGAVGMARSRFRTQGLLENVSMIPMMMPEIILITPAILSGALLSFAMSMDDVVISFFVTGTTSNTLPLQVYSMLKMGVTPEVNALCTLMLLVVFGGIGLYYLLTTLLKKEKKQ